VSFGCGWVSRLLLELLFFSGSVEQYIKTIGYLVPSYVIRRFLDSRHIHHLTDYLQAVHEKGQASADHTTLLLNCFTRLDRNEQLREFVENERDKKSIFDVDVAIKVCRNACLELSLELAKKHHKHAACLSILTEDLRAYKEALQYISNLPFDDADKTLKKFGKVLMDNCPADTIELLKKLCTDYVSNHPEELTEEFLDRSSQVYRGNPEDFMHLFIGKPKLLVDFLEHLVLNISGCSQTVYDTLIEQYLGIWQADKTGEARLMELIRNFGELYDKDHVLILCRMYEFWPGTLFLLEEDKLWHLVVRHYLQTGDYNNLLACCKRLGTSEPGLWLQTLAGLRNDANAPPHLLSQVLQVIGK
jgi:vacuolar protein sorting-associated protein 11